MSWVVVVSGRFYDQTWPSSAHGPFDTEEEAERWAEGMTIGLGQPAAAKDEWDVLPILSGTEPVPLTGMPDQVETLMDTLAKMASR